MRKVLIVGIDTRPVVRSALELGYEVYSVSYYKPYEVTYDVDTPLHERYALNQDEGSSSGFFEDDCTRSMLIELCGDWIDKVDSIIPCTGVSPRDFPRHKVLGNWNVACIVDKYRFYKRFENMFNIPLTFKVCDVYDIFDIRKQYQEYDFIVKPVEGSGGYGIRNLNNLTMDELDHMVCGEWIVQQYIPGDSISISILSTKTNAQIITANKQLIGTQQQKEQDYKYVGNITPYKDLDYQKIEEDIYTVFRRLKLIGSNGMDIINNNGEYFLIEVNPRIQGTFETIEHAYQINLLDAHIKACQGEIIPRPKPQQYSLKQIIYTKTRAQVGNLNIPGVHDIPCPNSIIEKDQPLCTLITSDPSLDKVKKINTEKIKKVKNNLMRLH